MVNLEKTVMDPPEKKGRRSEKGNIEFSETMGLNEYMKMQRAEILSDPNIYFTKQELGLNDREPTEEEAWKHYSQNGGPEDFRWRHLRYRNDVSLEEKEKYYYSDHQS